MATETEKAPEQRTATVDVADVQTEGKKLTGFAALYGIESRDLGGFTESIANGAFDDVLAGEPDVYLTFNHDPSKVIARTVSGTLRLRDESRGLAFEADLGDGPTAQDVREMVRRGDVAGASFRFVVGDETWEGERRTVTQIAELIDLSLATTPAYDGPTVELRSRQTNDATENGADKVSDDSNTAEERTDEARAEEKTTEERSEPKTTSNSAGSLRVEERASVPTFTSLTDAFRQRGFPAETASVSLGEFRMAAGAAVESESRAVTWGGTIDAMSRLQTTGGPLGYDQRYVWNTVPNQAVDAGVTSVQVFQQTARTLNAGTAVVRAIDATTNKPEVASTLNVTTVGLKQVAGVESGVPNVYLESDALASVVETDLRLQVSEGLDSLFVSAVASSGFQAPSTDNRLVSIRKAITTLRASGYTPNAIFLTPADSETIDLLVSGISGGTADFVFGAGRFAPGQLFGLDVVVSKSVAASVVLDTTAHGKMYVAPISLARFEENAGKTNTSLVRLETNAQYGTERTAAAIRIAAS